MAPLSARETADRVEAANQTVTVLLQKIDGNIARATDFAAQLLPQVPPPVLLHAQSLSLNLRGLVRAMAMERKPHLRLDNGPRIERSRGNPEKKPWQPSHGFHPPPGSLGATPSPVGGCVWP
ncbi:hypothetical protein T484DRAFT_1755522 [Baffinella frigidus]|nr:hypothetical protein T484DRAFT_1755522 [Cryptophyta sp. CCMP2293]